MPTSLCFSQTQSNPQHAAASPRRTPASSSAHPRSGGRAGPANIAHLRHRNVTVPTATRAARGSGQQGNKGKLVTCFVPGGMGHCFSSVKVNVRSPDAQSMSTHSQKNIPFAPVTWSMGAPGLSRTGPWFLSTAPLNFKRLARSFPHSHSFNPIFHADGSKSQLVPSTEAFRSFSCLSDNCHKGQIF